MHNVGHLSQIPLVMELDGCGQESFGHSSMQLDGCRCDWLSQRLDVTTELGQMSTQDLAIDKHQVRLLRHAAGKDSIVPLQAVQDVESTGFGIHG